MNMTANPSNLKTDFQKKIADLRAKRKIVIQSFKKKAETKKIEQIRASILK